ncbi:MAG: DUF4446 family protein [Candidatus Pacebacteria bacterium]|nr:DUF4446 family protein [Candidatus Paceibacterota bacterium]
MTITSFEILIIVLSVILVLQSIWLFVLHLRLKKLLRGKKAQDLEGLIGALGADIRELQKFQVGSTNYLKIVERRLRRSIQGVETIRFNAFKGIGEGGNQSFAVALLSEEGDGVAFSSLYARDRMSVFAKPIKNFTSENELTMEERDAISKAKRS